MGLKGCAAGTTGRAMPAINVIARQWQDAVNEGYGQQDLSVICRYLAEQHN